MPKQTREHDQPKQHSRIDFAAGSRQRMLEEMAAQELDVLVIGGGITGSGIALDPAPLASGVAPRVGSNGSSRS
jgi:heterodisulfide reductase subunit A-like polyferredoxin